MAADSYTALVKEFEKSAEATQSGDRTRVSRLALRDGAIALAALSFWAAADAWYAATGLSAAALLSVLDGIAAGAVLGVLAHEWGHFAGARWGGGIAPTTRFTQLFPIFVLDMQKSPERAFRAMSVGGQRSRTGASWRRCSSGFRSMRPGASRSRAARSDSRSARA